MTESGSPEASAPWLTMPAMLADNLDRFAERTAIVDGDMRLSYASFQQQMFRIAAGLRMRGLGQGDIVAIWAPNSWQWAASVAACWWCGCVVTPIPSRGKILDALPILRATGARLLFTCSGGNRPALLTDYLDETQRGIQDLCPSLQTLVDFSGRSGDGALPTVGFGQFGAAVADVHPPAPAPVAGTDLCEILFTSGSTGRPKGVLRQHAQVLRNRWSSTQRRGFRADDVLLATSEFSHTLGLNGVLLRSLMLGATLVIANTRNATELAALIHAEKVTAITAPPSLFASLLQQKVEGIPVCRGLRLASVGSAHIPPALLQQLLGAGIDSIVTGYGMTECDSIASTASTENVEAIATTVGTPEDGLDVEITDVSGQPVTPGSLGEIRVRGYAVTPGYLDEAGKLTPAANAQGWFQTGDLGRWTAAGFLQIMGRAKDVITIHGYTLYPAELEGLLLQSGMLRDVAVIGLPHAMAGEICVAFIVPKEPTQFSLRHLRLWARANIADYKIPGRFIELDELPLNRNKKVDRIYLKSSVDT